MSYRAILSANAQDDIRRMPDFLRAYVILQLQALELNPTLLSERSHFPFREGCQVFSFDYDRDEKRYFVNVLFQYGNDEQTLYVSDVPWQVAEDWWGRDGTNE